MRSIGNGVTIGLAAIGICCGASLLLGAVGAGALGLGLASAGRVALGLAVAFAGFVVLAVLRACRRSPDVR